MRVNGFGDDAAARSAAPAPDGNHDRFDAGLVFHNLKGIGSHPRDEEGLVPRVDVSKSLFPGQILRVLPRRVKVVAMKNDLSSQMLNGLHLHRIGLLRNADRCLDAKAPRPIGNRLAMVSCGGCDNAAAPLILGELGDEIDSAPYFKSAHRQVVFVFNIGLASQDLAQGGVVDEGRTGQILTDNSASQKHISECGGNEHDDGPLFFSFPAL